MVMTTETPSALERFECATCGERVVSQDKVWVEHARSTHHCPDPDPERQRVADRITMALKGLWDG